MRHWALIERAYGEYEISVHKSKKAAIDFIGCSYTSTKVRAGAYEISTEGTDNIVCTKPNAIKMGYVI